MHVRVDDVLARSQSRRVEPSDVVTITHLGWLADSGVPVVLDDYPELCVGDRGMWSLSPAAISKGRYVHGIADVYPFDGDEVVDTGRAVGPAAAIERLSVDELMARARRAGETNEP